MQLLINVQAHFDEDQFELHRKDGRKLLKFDAIPTVFSGSSHQRVLNLKRPVAIQVKHPICTTDHKYSKKPCLDQENLLHNTVNFPAASSTVTSSVEVPDCIMLDPLSQGLSSSQATISDSLSQFVAARNGDDTALICSLRKKIRRLQRKLRLACGQTANMEKNLSRS